VVITRRLTVRKVKLSFFDCYSDILRVLTALRMNKLKDCLIVFGPVNGSIFIENCENCTFVIAAQQV
jgi:hypothetical protein